MHAVAPGCVEESTLHRAGMAATAGVRDHMGRASVENLTQSGVRVIQARQPISETLRDRGYDAHVLGFSSLRAAGLSLAV